MTAWQGSNISVEETKQEGEREKNKEINEESTRDRKLHIRAGVTEKTADLLVTVVSQNKGGSA